AVMATHEVVTHLVAAQNHEQRDRKCKSIGEATVFEPSPFFRERKPTGERRRDKRRRKESQVKERMLGDPEAPAHAGRIWRCRVEARVRMLFHRGGSYLIGEVKRRVFALTPPPSSLKLRRAGLSRAALHLSSRGAQRRGICSGRWRNILVL